MIPFIFKLVATPFVVELDNSHVNSYQDVVTIVRVPCKFLQLYELSHE